MQGTCDVCEAKNVELSRATVAGIETFACSEGCRRASAADSQCALDKCPSPELCNDFSACDAKLIADAIKTMPAPSSSAYADMLAALDAAINFINDQYTDARAAALEGHHLASEARPIHKQLCEAWAKATDVVAYANGRVTAQDGQPSLPSA